MRMERRSTAFLACVAYAACTWVTACGDDDDNHGDHDHGGSDASAGHSGSSGGGAGRAGASGGSSETKLDFSTFDEALEDAIDTYNATSGGKMLPIRGASAVVVTKDGGLVHSKGYKDFAADRVYYIASSSKILSVGVVMKLADEGKLDITKPISDYLGDSWGEHKTSVSFQQLVSNSSGLPSLQELLAAGQGGDPEKLTQYAAHYCQYSASGTLSDCGEAIYQDDVPDNNREPDKTFRYGGSQWQLAGALAEQVSGKKWADLIREDYVEPCGAESLAYSNPFSTSVGSNALGYPADFDGDPANAPVTENPSIEGGAYVTGPDYAKLILMHLRDGKCGDKQVLSAKAVETMRTDRVAAYGGVVSDGSTPFDGYGLGWWISPDHIADPGAYGAYPFIDRERGYGGMILLEVDSVVGGTIALTVKPTLDKIIEDAQ